MLVLIFETNLMWSSRLVQSVRKLGHEAKLMNSLPDEGLSAGAAIVNLGEGNLDPKALVSRLKELRVPVIAHAGHKEKELMEIGRELGVERLATNSQLTYKLADLLAQVEMPVDWP